MKDILRFDWEGLHREALRLVFLKFTWVGKNLKVQRKLPKVSSGSQVKTKVMTAFFNNLMPGKHQCHSYEFLRSHSSYNKHSILRTEW